MAERELSEWNKCRVVEWTVCSVVMMTDTHTHTEKCGSGGMERIRCEEQVQTGPQGQGGEMRCVENVLDVVCDVCTLGGSTV